MSYLFIWMKDGLIQLLFWNNCEKFPFLHEELYVIWLISCASDVNMANVFKIKHYVKWQWDFNLWKIFISGARGPVPTQKQSNKCILFPISVLIAVTPP
jgi:hypothetical protein